MNKYKLFSCRYPIYFLLFFLTTGQLQAQEKNQYRSVKEALSRSSNLSGSQGPRSVVWIDNGNRYSYMHYNSASQSLEIRAYDPASDSDELVFDNTEYTFPGNDSTFEYDDFQWSEDSQYLVFESNFRPVYRRSGISDYYLYSIGEDEIQLLVKDARTAELSPDGTKIGFERGGDLFVHDIESGEEIQLTTSGRDNFYNGRFGWVYEEEFGLAQAWSWSPDSRYIAYWQTDERHVPLFQMTDYSAVRPEYEEIPYPKVGDENPRVRIGVVDVETSEKHWMDIETGDGYIPRIYWTSNEDELAIVHLNRAQNQLKLFFYDAVSGVGKLIMEEQSDTWIDVFDFFSGVEHFFHFPENQDEFFWISDRDGWSHIYRFDYNGNLLQQITDGDWEVTYLHYVDYRNNRIYYTSTEESPLERHMYSVNFNGLNKKKHTDIPGTHHIHMAENGQYYIDRYSNTKLPTQVELWSTTDGQVKKLEDNKSVSLFIENHVYAPRELFSFKTSDGRVLDGYMIRPVDFEPDSTYPLLLNIYGGPGAQGVYNSFETYAWGQYLAQEGYVIVDINNRGSGGYGREFEKMVYQQLGRMEAEDYVETAQFMAGKEWVDSERIAIRGHSYGGYMTLMAMFLHPEVFKVGIAGAPVTDWRLYDSIYTERYMGLLHENMNGYRLSAPITHAGNLQGNLLVAHSAMDENVHVQHTMQLMTALARNGKDADLRIYPPGAHGVAFNSASYFLLYETYTRYLNRLIKD